MTSRTAAAPVSGSVLRVAVLAVFGSLLASIDSTVVNVALPAVRADFAVSVGAVQWTVTGYLLALALVLPVSGWLTDRYGAKRIYLTALVGFTFASVLCGLASSLPLLVAARVVQGAVAGILAPMGQTIVAQIAGRDRLGRVMSVVATVGSLGAVLGPILGGALVTLGSWRWVFVVNVPIGILAVVLAARGLPPMPSDGGRRLDVAGLLTLGPGCAGLVYGLTSITAPGGHEAGVAVMVTGAVLVAAFVGRSLRLGSAALLDVRLFAVRSFAVGVSSSFLGRLAVDGGLLLIPLYLITVRGQSATLAGLLLIPNALGSLIALPFAGRFNDRLGPRTTATAGAVLGFAAGIPLAMLTAHTNLVWLAVVLFARGTAASVSGLPPVAAAYRDIDRQLAPTATTTLNVATRIGSPTGTAVFAATLTALATGGPTAASYAGVFVIGLIPLAAVIATSAMLPRGAPSAAQS